MTSNQSEMTQRLVELDPRWTDANVTLPPVSPQDANDAVKLLANITYTDQYKELMGYFWLAVGRREYSERVYDLTTRIIGICEGHYTVWKYRRDVIRELKLDPHQELAFIRQYTVEQAKNYQLWRQREVIVEMLSNSTSSDRSTLLKGEKDDLELALLDEPKNYHAWQYRRWLARQFQLPLNQELAFTAKMIRRDPYNNSAWNHRYYTLLYGGDTVDASLMAEEVRFVQSLEGSIEGNRAILSYLHAMSGRMPNFDELLVDLGALKSYRELFERN